MSELRQRFYLWRKFRGISTKRVLAKALRGRLTAMSKAENHLYFADSRRKGDSRHWSIKITVLRRLEKRHLRERRMIVSILDHMYDVPIENIFTNGPNQRKQTSFYRRYK